MVEQRRQKLVVPDVVGLQWENAILHLRNQGFPHVRVRYTEAYHNADTVVAQVPLKGQLAPPDDEVVLRVAKRSLMRFLPSVYQAASASGEADFMKNFLWLFQGIFDGIANKVDRVHEQFSPYGADEEFLPWLAQWVAITLDADWPAVKKRKILLSAAELYQLRGTAKAIERMLEIFTDVRPEIIENEWPYSGFWVGVHSSVGEDTVILPPMNLAHCFVVRFPRSFEELGEGTVTRIHQIIRAEKPAHTVYFLEFAEEKPAALAAPTAAAFNPEGGPLRAGAPSAGGAGAGAGQAPGDARVAAGKGARSVTATGPKGAPEAAGAESGGAEAAAGPGGGGGVAAVAPPEGSAGAGEVPLAPFGGIGTAAAVVDGEASADAGEEASPWSLGMGIGVSAAQLDGEGAAAGPSGTPAGAPAEADGNEKPGQD